MSRFLPLLVLTAALAACDVDFTEVTSPPADLPRIPTDAVARLSVDLVLDHRPLPELRLLAYLWPGTIEEDGSARAVSNDTLYLGERALAPQTRVEGGRRDYSWDPGPGVEHGTLSVTAPVVEGLAPLPAVRVRAYQRVGVDTLRAAAGDTLRFEVAPNDAAAEAPSLISWTLILSTPDLAIQRRDTTAVPAVLTVPGEWLEWAGSDPVHVRLSVRELWRRELADGEYAATIGVSSLMTWTVVWTDSISE